MTAQLALSDEDKVAFLMLLRGDGGIATRVLNAFESVPRGVFVSPQMLDFAYRDVALPFDLGQTMERPKQLARWLTALDIGASHKVLEVGSGTGYVTALLSALGGYVYGIEIYKHLMNAALERFKVMNAQNIRLQTGNGRKGLSVNAPFDRIFISGSVPSLPRHLESQLAVGGVALAPIGRERGPHQITLFTKVLNIYGDGVLEETVLEETYVPPLIKKI